MGWVGRNLCGGKVDAATSTLTLDFTELISINAAFGLAANSPSIRDSRAPIGVAKITNSMGLEDALLTQIIGQTLSPGIEILHRYPHAFERETQPDGCTNQP
jgi:hypothetical protein